MLKHSQLIRIPVLRVNLFETVLAWFEWLPMDLGTRLTDKDPEVLLKVSCLIPQTINTVCIVRILGHLLLKQSLKFGWLNLSSIFWHRRCLRQGWFWSGRSWAKSAWWLRLSWLSWSGWGIWSQGGLLCHLLVTCKGSRCGNYWLEYRLSRLRLLLCCSNRNGLGHISLNL